MQNGILPSEAAWPRVIRASVGNPVVHKFPHVVNRRRRNRIKRTFIRLLFIDTTPRTPDRQKDHRPQPIRSHSGAGLRCVPSARPPSRR